MGSFVVAEFILTSASLGPSALAELLVLRYYITTYVQISLSYYTVQFKQTKTLGPVNNVQKLLFFIHHSGCIF